MLSFRHTHLSPFSQEQASRRAAVEARCAYLGVTSEDLERLEVESGIKRHVLAEGLPICLCFGLSVSQAVAFIRIAQGATLPFRDALDSLLCGLPARPIPVRWEPPWRWLAACACAFLTGLILTLLLAWGW